MLEVTDLRVRLGGQEILTGASLAVEAGTVVTLIGRNGCGKSTTLRAIMGLVPTAGGAVRFLGAPLDHLNTPERARRGLAYVPQLAATFPDLSVEDNLRLGGRLLASRDAFRTHLDETYSLFPALAERRRLAARLLSGGQQRMLAVAMALVRDARMLLLDEPSAGLAPSVAEELLRQLIGAVGPGRAVLIVEQNIQAALAQADWVYVLREGSAGPPIRPAEILASRSLAEVL